MSKRQGRGEPTILTEQEWDEIRRISGEIMEAVMVGSIAHDSGQASMRRHIEMVLARNIAAAGKAYEDKLAAEETHTWEFGQHHIGECQIDWCGRYRGQRRESGGDPVVRQIVQKMYGSDEPPAMPGPTSYCRACARSGVGACDDFPNCPGGSYESQ